MWWPEQLPARDSSPWILSGSEQALEFFGWHIVLLMLIPALVAIWLAARRSRRRYDYRLEFTRESFDPCVLRSPVPVVVHFHQGWHIGNRVMETSLKTLAEKLLDRIPVGFVDVEEHPEIAARYPDLSIPAVAIFHRGEPLWVLEGVFYEDDVEDMLEQLEAAEKVDFGAIAARSEIPWEELRKGWA